MSTDPPPQTRVYAGIAVVIIHPQDDSLVLIGKRKGSHGSGTYALPGGYIDYGETFEGACLREIAEETGFQSDDIVSDSLKVIPIPSSNNLVMNTITNKINHTVTIYYQCKLKSNKDAVIMEPHRCDEWVWRKWGEFPSPVFHPLQYLVDSNWSPVTNKTEIVTRSLHENDIITSLSHDIISKLSCDVLEYSRKVELFKDFFDGNFIIRNNKNELKRVKLSETRSEDHSVLMSWYHGDDNPVSDVPNENIARYSDKKWHDWWIDKLKYGDKDCSTIKITLLNEPNDIILGFCLFQNAIIDKFDNQFTSLLRGIRVAPFCNREETDEPEYSGVGTCLIIYLLMKTYVLGTLGVGVNSSRNKYAEAFYSKLFNESKGNLMDNRLYFSCKNEERFDLILIYFNRYLNFVLEHDNLH